MSDKPKKRNGKLKIDAPFDDALKAALGAKPPEKKPKKKRGTRAKRPSA